MNITLDGFIAGPHRELDWHLSYWNNEMARHACSQLSLTDTILLGRVTYSAMESYWPLITSDLSFPRDDIAYADLMNTHTKVVFSSTLKATNWYNARIESKKPDLVVKELKRLPGKDMIIFGSNQLAQSLIRANLIDEYQLWTYPVLLGKGLPLFTRLKQPSSLRLVTVKPFSSGAVLMDYQVCRG